MALAFSNTGRAKFGMYSAAAQLFDSSSDSEHNAVQETPIDLTQRSSEFQQTEETESKLALVTDEQLNFLNKYFPYINQQQPKEQQQIVLQNRNINGGGQIDFAPPSRDDIRRPKPLNSVPDPETLEAVSSYFGVEDTVEEAQVVEGEKEGEAKKIPGRPTNIGRLLFQCRNSEKCSSSCEKKMLSDLGLNLSHINLKDDNKIPDSYIYSSECQYCSFTCLQEKYSAYEDPSNVSVIPRWATCLNRNCKEFIQNLDERGFFKCHYKCAVTDHLAARGLKMSTIKEFMEKLDQGSQENYFESYQHANPMNYRYRGTYQVPEEENVEIEEDQEQQTSDFEAVADQKIRIVQG